MHKRTLICLALEDTRHNNDFLQFVEEVAFLKLLAYNFYRIDHSDRHRFFYPKHSCSSGY